MGLFEDGIGPDRISDMASNVILPDLLAFNARVLKSLAIPTEGVDRLKNGNSYDADFPINPCFNDDTPVLLVPANVLRELPIATDWSDVADAAAKNSSLRTQANKQIAEIWATKTRKDKARLRAWALGSEKSFSFYLELLRGAKPTAYDLASDPIGELVWRRIAETIAGDQPFGLAPRRMTPTASPPSLRRSSSSSNS